jgi:hypothetical protein
MATEAVLETLRQLWLILSQNKLPAAIVGGLALATWKHRRTTYDVDVLVVAHGPQLQTMMTGLAQAGFKRTGDSEIDFGETSLLQFTFEPPDILVDVQVDLLMAKSDYAQQAVGRSVTLPAEALGFEVQVVRCEDLIIFKLLAGRIIDRADAAALLSANADVIDGPLLDELASQAGVAGELSDLRRDNMK